jgi:hypothetical protein
MTAAQHRELRRLEGRAVGLSLADGSRLDDVSLVSARTRTLWVIANGEDTFLAVDQVIDAWESLPLRPAA